MTVDRYSRFQIHRPEYLGDEHWLSIDAELGRLFRSLEAEDHVQTLGDLKCAVESVARVTLDIAGTPSDPNDAFDTLVNRAHGLLAKQPGRELAYDSAYGNLATQASKMARNLCQIRNQHGGGHGRARQPHVRDEMIDLALDGALIWIRWALRRLGYFSEGRPQMLIRDLIEDPKTFHAGTLSKRLEYANLPALEPHHQRALGVAVGQRTMRSTFVVRWDGLDPSLNSDDVLTWTPEYRLGLTSGLWFSPDDSPTITPESIKDGLNVLEPVPECDEELHKLVERIVVHTEPGLPGWTPDERRGIASFVRLQYETVRHLKPTR